MDEIKTTTIDGRRIVAVAVRTSKHKGMGEIAYALTQADEIKSSIFKRDCTQRISLSSHSLSTFGWDLETGGMNIVCWSEVVDANIASWVVDMIDNGYEAELR